MIKETVLIISGHGENDCGAVYGMENERDSIRPIAKKVYDKLNSNGFSVGYDWDNKKVKGEIELANKYNYDIIISLHRNSGKGFGYEVLYKSDNGKKLSTILDNTLKSYGYKSRGIKYRDNLGIINQTKGVSIILETDFIDTIGDEIKSSDIVESIYNTLIAYGTKSVCAYCGK